MNKQDHKSTILRLMYTLMVHLLVYTSVFGQELPTDTLINQNLTSDSIIQDTNLVTNTNSLTLVDTVDIVYDDGDIDGPITYSARDSIVYDMKNQKLYLYGEAKMKYTTLDMESDQIEFNWTTSTLTSRGKVDSLGNVVENAKFIEASGEYSADSMQYNFKTKKGRTFDVVTEQDGAYIHSEIVQKNQYDEWYGYKTKYTTCTNVDHPHFYLGANKSKVIPDKVMVTGPVNLVVSDINTPLYLPFGIFPTKTGKRSGIIMPEYGEQQSLGFFIKNGGYYWAVNDKVSLTFLEEVYTRGSFGLSVQADYRKIYKYNGGFYFQYFRSPPAFSAATRDGATNDMTIRWSHSMDSKARPKNSFSANVNGKTSTYNTNSRRTDVEQALEAAINSNITYTRRFKKPIFSLNVNAKHDQNFNTHRINLTLPEVSFNASRFTPFQKKIQTDKKAFYEKIGFRYNVKAKAAISTIDSTFLERETLQEIQYGMIQTATVDAPFNLMKYFTINPSFNYTERWYFKKENRIYTGDSIEVAGPENTIVNQFREFRSEKSNGFYGVRDFNFQTNVSTTITGIYNFKGKKLKAIRHVFKPTLNYRFTPDFGAERWKYYDEYYNEITDRVITYNHYSFLDRLYGTPSTGLENLMTINLTNNFDMKVLNKKDTVESIKKVPLIEQFNISTGYDFTADSLKIKPVQISARSSLFNNLISWNAAATFSPYAINDKRQLIDETYFSSNKRVLRFDRANVSLSLNLKGKTKAKDDNTPLYGTVDEREYIQNNPNLFFDFNVPWSLSIGYRMNITKGVSGNIDSTLVTANSLTLSGHLNITPKWQINFSTGYDIRNKDLTYTKVRVERDLHCWVLAFDWVAYPLVNQTYSIDLHVKSAILQELKLSRKQPLGTGTTGTF